MGANDNASSSSWLAANNNASSSNYGCVSKKSCISDFGKENCDVCPTLQTKESCGSLSFCEFQSMCRAKESCHIQQMCEVCERLSGSNVDCVAQEFCEWDQGTLPQYPITRADIAFTAASLLCELWTAYRLFTVAFLPFHPPRAVQCRVGLDTMV